MNRSGWSPRIPQLVNPYAPSGALAETFPRGIVGSNNSTGLVTQTLQMTAVYLSAGMVITSGSHRSGTTTRSLPTNWWIALYDSARSLIRQSTDQLTTAWGANTVKTLNLDSIPATAGARVASAVVTLTIPTLSQSLSALVAAGDSIVVSNANVAAYNGTFTVDSITATTIVYTSGSSATDSLVAPFPTVQLAAAKRTYTVPTTALYYLGLMFKGTVGTDTVLSQFASLMGDTPILSGTADAALTGTAPSPAAAITAVGATPYGYVS